MFAKFKTDRSGQFSVFFAASSLLLVPAFGIAIDVTNQLRSRTDLQNMVDTAALSGGQLAFAGASDDDIKAGVRASFSANCQLAVCNAVKLEISLDDEFIQVWAKESIKTTVMGIAGVKTLPIEARARVNIGGANEHYEVHLVIDNTGSMNIVDGVAAINKFKPLYKPYEKYGSVDSCAFACHISTDGSGYDVLYGGKTGAEIAKANGIPMREDRIHTEMAEQAKRLLDGKVNIAVGVHAFTWGLTTLQKPTDKLDKVKLAINNVTNTSEGTQYAWMAPEADKAIGPAGDGKSPLSPRKVVVLMTDGVQQNKTNYKPELMELKTCDLLKKDGRELYVFNIVYPDPSLIGGDQGPGGSPQMVRDFYADIKPRLRACASSDEHYFEADYGTSIDEALKKITDKILKVGTGNGNFFLSM